MLMYIRRMAVLFSKRKKDQSLLPILGYIFSEIRPKRRFIKSMPGNSLSGNNSFRTFVSISATETAFCRIRFQPEASF
jgi:hypothetical protein